MLKCDSSNQFPTKSSLTYYASLKKALYHVFENVKTMLMALSRIRKVTEDKILLHSQVRVSDTFWGLPQRNKNLSLFSAGSTSILVSSTITFYSSNHTDFLSQKPNSVLKLPSITYFSNYELHTTFHRPGGDCAHLRNDVPCT